MSKGITVRLSADENSEATTCSIDDVREFVSNLIAINAEIREVKAEKKEVVEGMEEVQRLQKEIKDKKEELKRFIESNAMIKTYQQKVEEKLAERDDIIEMAKEKGVPRKEVDVAVKALKHDIDLDSSLEIFASISDLIDD